MYNSVRKGVYTIKKNDFIYVSIKFKAECKKKITTK